MAYSLNFTKNAIKELSKITEPYYSNIKSAIEKLANDPFPSGHKKLKGRTGFRIRVGPYRIIYDVFESELIIDIISIGHRKDIYD